MFTWAQGWTDFGDRRSKVTVTSQNLFYLTKKKCFGHFVIIHMIITTDLSSTYGIKLYIYDIQTEIMKIIGN